MQFYTGLGAIQFGFVLIDEDTFIETQQITILLRTNYLEIVSLDVALA